MKISKSVLLITFDKFTKFRFKIIAKKINKVLPLKGREGPAGQRPNGGSKQKEEYTHKRLRYNTSIRLVYVKLRLNVFAYSSVKQISSFI